MEAPIYAMFEDEEPAEPFSPWHIWDSQHARSSVFSEDYQPLHLQEHLPLPLWLAEHDQPIKLEPLHLSLEASCATEASSSATNSTLEDSITLPDTVEDVCTFDEQLRFTWDLFNDDHADWQKLETVHSWDTFHKPDFKEPRAPYLSEASTNLFDKILRPASNNTKECGASFTKVWTKGRLRSVFLAGIDCSADVSMLEDQPFAPSCAEESVQATIFACGQRFRELDAFVEKCYLQRDSSPAMVALCHSIRSAILMLKHSLYERSLCASTIIQLWMSFKDPLLLVDALAKMTRSLDLSMPDHELISILFNHALRTEREGESTVQVFKALLRCTSRPWLDAIESWIGLQTHNPPHTTTPALTKASPINPTDPKNGIRCMTFEMPSLPSFVPKELGKVICDIGRNRQILEDHNMQASLRFIKKISLNLAFSWQELQDISDVARDHWQSLRAHLETQGRDSNPTHEDSQVQEIFTENTRLVPELGEYSWDAFMEAMQHDQSRAQALPSRNPEDELLLAVQALADGSKIHEHAALHPELANAVGMAIGPLVESQKRLMDFFLLRLLFKDFNLRAHLELQHDYQLLGNGSFVTKLSQALFDPQRATAERKKGVIRHHESMGLRLGETRSWPPASSELQLTLMNIISECFTQSALREAFDADDWQDAGVGRGRVELPGSFNFAIRQLPPADADRCMDASSVYALDFLRLQYQAASPLHVILTSASLEKYDMIFKFLLRLQRVLFVVFQFSVTGLDRAFLGLRWEMLTFVATCSHHFHIAGVAESWDTFAKHLDIAERYSKNGHLDTTQHQQALGSVEGVMRVHDACLDRIMSALLLRESQATALALLEKIFNDVLEFATLCGKIASNAEAGPNMRGDGDLRKLRSRFRGHLSGFLEACRELATRLAGSCEKDEGLIARLLSSLESCNHG